MMTDGCECGGVGWWWCGKEACVVAEMQVGANVGLEVQIFAAFRKMGRSREWCQKTERCVQMSSWVGMRKLSMRQVESSRDVGAMQCGSTRHGERAADGDEIVSDRIFGRCVANVLLANAPM